MNLHPFRSLGRDLFFDTNCTCQDPKWAQDKEIGHLFKTKVLLTGYADDNFMDRMNAGPQEGSCSTCGRSYRYQWRWDGVMFEFTEPPQES